MERILPMMLLLMHAAICGAEEGIAGPTGPISVTSSGILFDGGSLSIQFTDATETAWQLNYPPIEEPLPMPRSIRVMRSVVDAPEPLPLVIGGDDEARIYNLLVDWLDRNCTDEEIAGIRDETIWDTFAPGRSIFDATPNDDTPPSEPDPRWTRISQAAHIVSLLEAVTVERACVINPQLKEQYDTFLSDFNDQEVIHHPIVMDELRLRWQQFHDTAKAALCGMDWSPTQVLELKDSAEESSATP